MYLVWFSPLLPNFRLHKPLWTVSVHIKNTGSRYGGDVSCGASSSETRKLTLALESTTLYWLPQGRKFTTTRSKGIPDRPPSAR